MRFNVFATSDVIDRIHTSHARQQPMDPVPSRTLFRDKTAFALSRRTVDGTNVLINVNQYATQMCSRSFRLAYRFVCLLANVVYVNDNETLAFL